MRKLQQKKILDLLQTLDEAQTAGLFADCQECALQIGEFIESSKSKGTQTVSLLEEYFKMLYRASIGEVGKKQLKKKLVEIENSTRKELAPNRIEVAFFSYKASMWDSLESIYLSAKEDPQCDVYMIPIPYFDRLPDGSLGQMHHESGEYPADIPITDWRKYDVEARRPDIIFIHSPYDNGSYVTSIHPDFYSERLKKFTELLVYIPYFVCLNDVPDHFCVCAGTMNADKVIVQSDKVRQTYIRVFKEFESMYNCKGVYGNPEEKFVALGSPKMDKVLSTKREDCALPDEWRSVIEGKKVVFYNTTISALLQGDEQYLKKIRSVLYTLRERDDAALWWRPHPLNEATYQAMRPQLLDEYRQIIAEYRREGWGIYDNTPDLHRAIAWSDAYYGDGSSVVALYGLTGKMIMYQNCKISGRKRSYNFDEVIAKLLELYAHDNSYNKDLYILWEATDTFFNNYIDYLFKSEKSEFYGEFVKRKNELFNRIAINTTGTSGAMIYASCRREVFS